MSKRRKEIEGVDISFGLPPEEYSYRCSHFSHEMEVNEAIIDVEVFMALNMTACIKKALCQYLAALILIEKQWNMLEPKSPPEGR